ncbi:cellulase family glycosylhydrolase [Paucilactobacillus oligofermentans]|uniref:cellulase family glycosylhydrolase n=1 Tax=Paucilactobacillus oligofermentans TaxID=293371 RepID=UPI000DD4720E
MYEKININFLRVPINYRNFIDDNTLEFKKDGLEKLKRLLDYCEKYQIFCMLDMHTSPGGQNPDWHSDNRTGVPQFWEFKSLRNQLVEVWGKIASELANQYSYLLGYDLLNEPAMADMDTLNSFYNETIDIIRKSDTNHAVIVEGDHFAMDMSELDIKKDSKMIISFHYYPTVWKENLLDRNLDRAERKKEFDLGLIDVLNTIKGLNVPLICGEAGYDIKEDDIDFSMELLEDTIDIFESRNISWCLWAYKDACFMGLTHPKKDSDWMKLVDEVHTKWTHYDEMSQANKITHKMAQEFNLDDKDLEYELQFRVRGILYRYQQEGILIPLLEKISWQDFISKLDSFSFDNCDYYDKYEKLLMKYTS